MSDSQTGALVSFDKQSDGFRSTLVGDIAPGWRLVQPLPVHVESDEEGDIVIADEKFGIFGEGHDLESATTDFVASLIEYHDLVSAHKDEPSRKLLSLVRIYLQPTNIPHE